MANAMPTLAATGGETQRRQHPHSTGGRGRRASRCRVCIWWPSDPHTRVHHAVELALELLRAAGDAAVPFYRRRELLVARQALEQQSPAQRAAGGHVGQVAALKHERATMSAPRKRSSDSIARATQAEFGRRGRWTSSDCALCCATPRLRSRRRFIHPEGRPRALSHATAGDARQQRSTPRGDPVQAHDT